MPPPLMDLRCCLLPLIKRSCLQKAFKNSNVDDSNISMSVSPSVTNLKLFNIHENPKLVKKVIINLELLKASGSD